MDIVNPNKIDMSIERTPLGWEKLYESVKLNVSGTLTKDEQVYYIKEIEPKVLTTSARCQAIADDVKAGAADIDDIGN